ncbi:MAG: [Fe-Fe] hydrogenase large subunit C-terminal domain-containing protein [Candidatus Eremiobacterota bacterium]
MIQKQGQVIYTNKAACQDCYRCVRVCPVKAIQMQKGQAFVVEKRCISCGTCVRECPQGAKSFRNDIEKAIALLSHNKVAASIAPSFVSLFGEWERACLPSALRKLGFSYVAETAAGAYYVAKRTGEIAKKNKSHPHICTACPALVSYVEKYMPELIDLLVPVMSPMVAHGKYIKEKLGSDTKVIFIGPCTAKKAEADREENRQYIDCVLTFTELFEWFSREEINLERCEESNFNEEPHGDSRYFPLTGGLARTAAMSNDILDINFLPLSGFDEIKEALENISPDSMTLIEPLFCHQGCINGPGIPKEKNIFQRRLELLHYAEKNKGTVAGDESISDIEISFHCEEISDRKEITEEEIRKVLEKTGKTREENQLNCGACGYHTCRDKAIAVIQGMAEPEMCIPYMRRLAEQRSDKIIETSPNGIVILDDKLNIISMNPAFRQLFMCTESIYGKRISYLIDPEPFEKLASGEENFIKTTVKHEAYNIVCHEMFYKLEQERQFVGIFVNITTTKDSQEKLKNLRAETIKQSRELLEHQINMAQELAKFLGESTARGEELVQNLVRLAEEKEDQKKDRWLKDMYM